MVFAGVGEIKQSNWYRLDTAPIDEEHVFTLPIHQRNDNFEVRISSDSPILSHNERNGKVNIHPDTMLVHDFAVKTNHVNKIWSSAKPLIQKH